MKQYNRDVSFERYSENVDQIITIHVHSYACGSGHVLDGNLAIYQLNKSNSSCYMYG